MKQVSKASLLATVHQKQVVAFVGIKSLVGQIMESRFPLARMHLGRLFKIDNVARGKCYCFEDEMLLSQS